MKHVLDKDFGGLPQRGTFPMSHKAVESRYPTLVRTILWAPWFFDLLGGIFGWIFQHPLMNGLGLVQVLLNHLCVVIVYSTASNTLSAPTTKNPKDVVGGPEALAGDIQWRRSVI